MTSATAKRLLSALFYAICSLLIVFVNKIVLTTYKFPSFQFLALGQMGSTIIILFIARTLDFITFPTFSVDVMHKIWPLPLLYIGNLVFGLGGTQQLSLPMFTVLRRFSILMTMIGERIILGVHPSISIQLTVYAMIGGSVVAALNDLSFDAVGYGFVLMNNFFTAANGVYMKQKLEAKELGKFGLLFYNSFFMFPILFFFCWKSGEFQKAFEYGNWDNPMFAAQFVTSCIMGFLLVYSVLLCTQFNSALTTTIIGCLKNVLVTYVGIIIGGDYVYSAYNFMGLNISIVGSIAYSWLTFRSKAVPSAETEPVLPSVVNKV